MKRVLAAMSGGVDSSVTAALLKEQGYEVIGVTMKLLDTMDVCDESRSCCGYDAARDAKVVADSLGIPHYTINAVEAFKEWVIDDFVGEYTRGRTPNPCIRCNYFLKFDFLMKKARELGCEFLATGHYAIMENGTLRRGVDQVKDQSYFLYPVFANDPCKILFPLGRMCKSEVREIAGRYNLLTAQKKESQDICFIPDGDYASFLKEKRDMDVVPGYIVDLDGNRVGTHQGVQFYTVGQRKGLGALGCRMYVKEIRVKENEVVVARDEQLFCDAIEIEELLSQEDQISVGDQFLAQVRYRSKPVGAVVEDYRDGKMVLRFDTPVRAVAPGQSAVLYRDDVVVAGGLITREI
ncbi:tRNA-specific 2-thiouridylase MnmA [Chitinispirillum alkaliphilum]|nr:tRNA-specific 2-thiouridylase MnmA [Chitinispirillum alkaliphilum]